jgi:hypothetical protein
MLTRICLIPAAVHTSPLSVNTTPPVFVRAPLIFALASSSSLAPSYSCAPSYLCACPHIHTCPSVFTHAPSYFEHTPLYFKRAPRIRAFPPRFRPHPLVFAHPHVFACALVFARALTYSRVPPHICVQGSVLQVAFSVVIRHTRPGRPECLQNVPISAAHNHGGPSKTTQFHSQPSDYPNPYALQVQPNPPAAARLHAPILPTPLCFRLDPISFHFTPVCAFFDPFVSLFVFTFL